ncbi:MAG: HDOD domain-containing protein [Sulfuricurvum sp.]|nr:HDOD domain-containing protein [Sulfuricurvum sp.]
MSSQLIGRQPIIDHHGDIVAYELFYESSSLQQKKSESTQASVIVASLIDTFSVKTILGNTLGFIKIDETFLMSTFINSVPKNLFVFSLLGSINITKETHERIRELHAQGYLFALHDIDFKTTGTIRRFATVIPFLSYIKINLKNLPQEYLAKLTETFKAYQVDFIATNINTNEEYAIAKAFDYKYVEGYFFSEPVIIEHKTIEPKAMAIIQLYNMLKSDISIEELISTFESNHELTIQLLQYINSSSFFFSKEVSSIHQVLTLLGREPLSNWLLLLLYGKSVNHSKSQSALMQMVSKRSALMKGLYKLMYPNSKQSDEDKAFFVGVMSLSSTVMSMPLNLILKEINLSDDVNNALLEQTGVYGELLIAVEAIEKFDVEKIREFIAKYSIETTPFLRLMSDISTKF